jgi:cytochrome c-type biogenesis protein CcmH
MMRWARGFLAGVVVLVLSGSALAIDPIELADPALQERYRELTHELRCMQCQNQSIADSPVGLAGDLRREVRELLEAGKTDAEIRDHLRARYGDFNWRNAWLWVTPVILLLLGLAVAMRVIRQRARLAATDTSSPDDPVA